MAKKAKKRLHPMPKLGWKDLLLYWSAMILACGGALGSFVIVAAQQDKIAFADETVVAATVGPGNGNNIWLSLWCLLAFVLILAGPYQHRIPVFGRNDIKYGPPAYPRTYPLLMKDKPKYWVSPKAAARKKHFRIALTAILLVTFLFSAAMFPLSIYGRTVLHQDGSITIYDAHDREAAHYSAGEITAVRLDTERAGYGRHGSSTWYAEMAIESHDREICFFAMHTFSEDTLQALQTMLALKERYGDLVVISGTENLRKVVWDQHLTGKEKVLLYRLFEFPD